MIALPIIVACVIALAALAGAVRLLAVRRDGRAALLAALMLGSGLLLYFTLYPPRLPVGGETLVVATAEAPTDIKAQRGERLVALPEASAIAGAERVPDLATALRRHQQAARLRIIGRGLVPRDREMAAGVPVDFTPLAIPRGLVRFDPPPDTPAGAIFTVAGEVKGITGGTAELLDPAGRRVDRRAIRADGTIVLGGTARAPGLALFTLRLRGRDARIVSDTPVPLRTLEQRPLRVLLIGSPSPEVKFLRRWAEDSGIDLASRIEVGGGVNLGGDPVRLDAGTLREVDVVIIDDHLLASLGGASRAAMTSAVADGLGVVIRMTAPANAAARESWRKLGLSVEDGSEVVPVALPPLALDEEALAARRGPGTPDAPPNMNTIDDPAPDLGRWQVKAGPGIVAAVSDADGGFLSGWQQRQQGRVALWTIANSFALVLNGQGDRYYQWWSDTVSAVARPDDTFRPEVPVLPLVGQQMAVCGVSGSAKVTGPDAKAVPLVIDPAAGARGCAGYWPLTAGVHKIMQPGRDGVQEFSFFVFPEAALAVPMARAMGEATAQWAAAQDTPAARNAVERSGPRWPYFLGWLLLSGLLWFGERRWLARPA
jgi:hypothetical protein